MRKALVTGATGLIGRYLVRRLLDDGISVRAMVRAPAVPPMIDGAELTFGDIRDPVAVERAVDGCSHVFHLAAQVTHASSLRELWPANVEAVRCIAQACLAHGVQRFVFVSSNSVYGRAVTRHGVTEETPLQPDSGYGQSKAYAERVLADLHREAALPMVIVRTSNVIADDARAWLDAYRLVECNRFRLLGRGDGLHTFTAMSDFVDGLLLCATCPGIEGRTYIIAGEPPVSLREWLAIFAEEAGTAAPVPTTPNWPLEVYRAVNRTSLTLTGRPLPKADRLDMFLGSRRFDCSKAKRELGYAPRVSGEAALRRMARSMRDERAAIGTARS